MTNTFQSTETNYEMQQTTHTTSSVQVLSEAKQTQNSYQMTDQQVNKTSTVENNSSQGMEFQLPGNNKAEQSWAELSWAEQSRAELFLAAGRSPRQL